MEPKKPLRTNPFGPEPKTAPSPSSGHYRARPVIVEEVAAVVPQPSRRSSGVLPIPPSDAADCTPTPRPRISIHAKPRVVKHEAELVDVPLEPRAAFLLGLIDGKSRVQTLIDISGMEEADVVELLERLLVFGVISVD